MALDVRTQENEEMVSKIIQFIKILKYPNIPTDEAERERFGRGLGQGEKSVVYQILQWSLQRLPSLQKRAYLAKYLVPEQIPQEFMMDEVLVEIHDSHKQLQQQFKEVHKKVEKLRAQPTRPAEIKGEITTLEVCCMCACMWWFGEPHTVHLQHQCVPFLYILDRILPNASRMSASNCQPRSRNSRSRLLGNQASRLCWK